MTTTAVALAVLLAASPQDDGTAEPAALAARFDAGRDLFDQGQYAEAAEVFARLHAESGDAAVLYPAAQSLRLAGRCAEALTAYRGFAAQSQLLRDRAQATGSEARVKRLALDLQNSSGRIVEMQACVGRSAAQNARATAGARRLSGDRAGALALLTEVWEQTNDPTVLPELAELHRGLGACQQAITLLDLAVTTLGPIEVLDEAGAQGSDIAAAHEALQRARTARADASCVSRPAAAQASQGPGRAAAATASSTHPAGVVERDGGADVARPVRPRWPLWAAGAGGGLAVGGAVFLVLAHRTESQVETIRTKAWSDEGDRLLSRGNLYEGAGLALSIGGVVIAGGAVAYYYLSAKKGEAQAAPSVQLSRGAATLLWTGSF